MPWLVFHGQDVQKEETRDGKEVVRKKQEVSLKKIIVEGYRAVDFSLRTFCCCFLLISITGKTYKSAIKRPIKIRTHHVVQKHTRTSSCKGGQTAGRRFRWTDGQI